MKRSPATIKAAHRSDTLKDEQPPSQSSQFSRQYFPIPPFIPELESLSKSHLRSLHLSEEVLNQFVEEQLPQATTVFNDVEIHSDTIERIAKSISSVKIAVVEKRQKLVDHYETLNRLKQEWDTLNSEHQTLSQRYLPSNIEANLLQVATVAEEKSEEIAETFLSGQMDVETFLNSYTASRTVSHLRKTKEEILHRQLLQLQRLGYWK